MSDAAGDDSLATSSAAAAGPPMPRDSLGQVIWAWLGWGICFNLLSAIVIGSVVGIARAAGATSAVGLGCGIFVGGLAQAGLMLWVARRGLRRLPPAAPRQAVPRLAAAVPIVLALAAAAVTVRLAGPEVTLPSLPDGPLRVPTALGMVLGFGILMLFTVVLAPVAEELFFREWLWRRLEPRGAVLIGSLTGLLWILLHLRGPLGSLVLVPLALLLGWTRARGGSVRLCMAVHGAWNAVATGVPVVPAVIRSLGSQVG